VKIINLAYMCHDEDDSHRPSPLSRHYSGTIGVLPMTESVHSDV